MKEDEEIGLGLYSEEALDVCANAVAGASRLTPYGITAKPSGEVTYIVLDGVLHRNDTPVSVKTRIARRMKWYSNELKIIAAKNGADKKFKSFHERRSKEAACIHDILKNEDENSLYEKYGEGFVKNLKGVKADPMSEEAISLLKHEIEQAFSDASHEVDRITKEIFAERDKKIDELRKRMEDIKKQMKERGKADETSKL